MSVQKLCSVVVIWLCLMQSLISSSFNDRPNFIYILTDDQDLLFDSVSVMPSLLQNIRDQGIEFRNAFVATSICCPSRTETLTGRYFQNIRLPQESMNECMHIAAKYNVLNNTKSMFQMLSNAGYTTGIFGKMTNDQADWWCTPMQQGDPPYIEGFSRVNVPCQEDFYQLLWFDKYLNGSYLLNNLTESPSNYYTSVIGNASIQFLKDIIESQSNSPFMIWIGPHSPHLPATPAAWHANKFPNITAPRTPNFGIQSPDKIDFISTNPPLHNISEFYLDQEMNDRLSSLVSVDDIIYEIFELLNKYPNILNNTYFIFTSDHGYHLGQWRVPHCKYLPYDTDIRVPMFMRGPNIKAGLISDDVVGNIDILPTVLSLAEINYDEDTYDGMDLSEIFGDNENSEWERDIYLSQYISVHTKASAGSCWFPNDDGSFYPGQDKSAGCCDENNQAYMLDDEEIGNWRLLRIINETHNVVYIEWYQLNPEYIMWNDTVFNKPYHYEYYDLNDDLWQINNIYKYFPHSQQTDLHNMLMKYGSCKGTDCR